MAATTTLDEVNNLCTAIVNKSESDRISLGALVSLLSPKSTEESHRLDRSVVETINKSPQLRRLVPRVPTLPLFEHTIALENVPEFIKLFPSKFKGTFVSQSFYYFRTNKMPINPPVWNGDLLLIGPQKFISLAEHNEILEEKKLKRANLKQEIKDLQKKSRTIRK